MNNLLRGISLAVACLGVPQAWAEEPAQAQPAPAFSNEKAHGYLSLELIGLKSTISGFGGDQDASGAGFGVRGAAHSGKISQTLDIGMSGQFQASSRQPEGGGNDIGSGLYEIDGGLRFSDLFYLSLGFHSRGNSQDGSGVTTTYSIIPIGIGVLTTQDAGYVLLQLKGGGGRLTDDDDTFDYDVKYFGARAILQHGYADGVQFMAGLGLDRYKVDDIGVTDKYVSFELGLGFGL